MKMFRYVYERDGIKLSHEMKYTTKEAICKQYGSMKEYLKTLLSTDFKETGQYVYEVDNDYYTSCENTANSMKLGAI